MTSASPDIVVVVGGIGDGALVTVWLEPKLLLSLDHLLKRNSRYGALICQASRQFTLFRVACRPAHQGESAVPHECGMTLAFHAH